MRTTLRRTLLASCTTTVALLGATLTGCGSSSPPTHPAAAASPRAGFPVTVGPSSAPVRIAARPTAIVSLSPTATEMLYAIGAGGQMKAVDKFSDYPPQAPRTQLTALQPSVEAIVALKPDLVVVSGDSGGLAKRLSSLSVPVLVEPAATTVGDVYAEIDELGRATGHAAQARAESDRIRTQLDRIVSATPHRSVSYYYELEPDYYSVTSDTFVGTVLGMIGMHSIADAAGGAKQNGGYPQLSAEYILKANPDYILLADTKCCAQTTATVAARPGWSALTAVRDHHVVALDDDIASRWGPRIVDLLRTVADAVSSGAPAGSTPATSTPAASAPATP